MTSPFCSLYYACKMPAIHFPPSTPATHSTTLAIAYAAKAAGRPLCRRSSDSREKVENVVNPPQMPTFKKSTVDGFRISVESAVLTTMPIRTAPNTLISSVSSPSDSGIPPPENRLPQPQYSLKTYSILSAVPCAELFSDQKPAMRSAR